MLKRVFVDNFKCLVNFNLCLHELSLLLGPNGTGKTTIFEVIGRLRGFLSGKDRVNEAFPSSLLTKWELRPIQTFECEVEGPAGLFLYKLVIEHNKTQKKVRVANEMLSLNGKPLFDFKQGIIQLYRDDNSVGPGYSFNWTQSGLASIMPSKDNTSLTWFLEQLQRYVLVSLRPYHMTCDTSSEEEMLSAGGENFASWYRHLLQEYGDFRSNLLSRMQEIFPGFNYLRLARAGSENRILEIGFSSDRDEKATYYRFNEISDGQRVLVVLYTMLFVSQEAGYTLFLDEPENYVALSELQPWLMELRDACGASLAQAILISHHPEMIDYLGVDNGIWLEREPNSPARIVDTPEMVDARIVDTPEMLEGGLRLSQLVARGWRP